MSYFNLIVYNTKSLMKERATPSKYYVADVGLRNEVVLSQSEDDGLISASTITNCINCKIITFNQSLQLKDKGINIDVIPAWRYALT